jgi:hypothetical protein
MSDAAPSSRSRSGQEDGAVVPGVVVAGVVVDGGPVVGALGVAASARGAGGDAGSCAGGGSCGAADGGCGAGGGGSTLPAAASPPGALGATPPGIEAEGVIADGRAVVAVVTGFLVSDLAGSSPTLSAAVTIPNPMAKAAMHASGSRTARPIRRREANLGSEARATGMLAAFRIHSVP